MEGGGTHHARQTQLPRASQDTGMIPRFDFHLAQQRVRTLDPPPLFLQSRHPPLPSPFAVAVRLHPHASVHSAHTLLSPFALHNARTSPGCLHCDTHAAFARCGGCGCPVGGSMCGDRGLGERRGHGRSGRTRGSSRSVCAPERPEIVFELLGQSEFGHLRWNSVDVQLYIERTLTINNTDQHNCTAIP